MDVNFIWTESYTHDKVKNSNPAFERLSMIFNLAIMHNQLVFRNISNIFKGICMMQSKEEKFKEAAKIFMIAGSLFEKIITEQVMIKDIQSMDFSEQVLQMHSHLMKAQAQYCAFEKVKLAATKNFNLLAKLAKQASILYGKAYLIASKPPITKTVDKTSFTSVVQFNELSFLYQAHFYAASQFQQETEETAEGMGKAVINIRKAKECIDNIKSFEKDLSPALLSQYQVFAKQCSEKFDFIEDQNKKIYHEEVPTIPAEIESLAFSQPISIDNELNAPFEGQEAFSQLVPLPVRLLEREYKNETSAYMESIIKTSQQCDSKQEFIIGKHCVSSKLDSNSGSPIIPDGLWAQVSQCKEKGGPQKLQEMIDQLYSISGTGMEALEKIGTMIQNEEDEDKNMKLKYGINWKRESSIVMNKGMKNQLNYYTSKFGQAKEEDTKIETMYSTNKANFILLDKDRAGLSELIPKKRDDRIDKPRNTSKLSDLLSNLAELKKSCETIIAKMLSAFDNDAVTNEMYEIHKGIKNKQTVTIFFHFFYRNLKC